MTAHQTRQRPSRTRILSTNPHYRRAIAAWVCLLVTLTLRPDLAALADLLRRLHHSVNLNAPVNPVAIPIAVFLHDVMEVAIWAAFVCLPVVGLLGVVRARAEYRRLRSAALSAGTLSPAQTAQADALILRLAGGTVSARGLGDPLDSPLVLPPAVLQGRRRGTVAAIHLYTLLLVSLLWLWADGGNAHVAPPYRYYAPVPFAENSSVSGMPQAPQWDGRLVGSPWMGLQQNTLLLPTERGATARVTVQMRAEMQQTVAELVGGSGTGLAAQGRYIAVQIHFDGWVGSRGGSKQDRLPTRQDGLELPLRGLTPVNPASHWDTATVNAILRVQGKSCRSLVLETPTLPPPYTRFHITAQEAGDPVASPASTTTIFPGDTLRYLIPVDRFAPVLTPLQTSALPGQPPRADPGFLFLQWEILPIYPEDRSALALPAAHPDRLNTRILLPALMVRP